MNSSSNCAILCVAVNTIVHLDLAPKSARERSLSDAIAMFQFHARSPMQELRDLTRERKQLTREISQHALHII